MSDANETMGRCRSEMTAAYKTRGFLPNDSDEVIADALDRLAADVAEIKATLDGISAEDVRHFVESEKAWVALVEEQRDSARYALADAQAEVERLRGELAARPAAAGWLTKGERRILAAHVKSLREQRFALERGGQTLGYSANPGALKHEADAIDALLARVGSPPVVEVPVMHAGGIHEIIHVRYRAALDKAGVAWKEEPRE